MNFHNSWARVFDRIDKTHVTCTCLRWENTPSGNWRNCKVVEIHPSYCWWKKSCTSWFCSLSHYFQGFIHPRWLAGFLPSTVGCQSFGFADCLGFNWTFLVVGMGWILLNLISYFAIAPTTTLLIRYLGTNYVVRWVLFQPEKTISGDFWTIIGLITKPKPGFCWV